MQQAVLRWCHGAIWAEGEHWGPVLWPLPQSRADLAQVPQGPWSEVHEPHFVPRTQKALLFFSLILLWNANNSLMLVPGDCVVSLLSSGDLSTFLRGGHIHELRNICLETHWYFNTFFLLQGCPKQTGHFYGLNDLPIENPLIASPFVS